ncbi:hypothetical protein NIE88_12660 [Sporolactobacillus shoreicorticis]|uniref:HTH cro/C1-type domain-containing protein n=1 Tax=Sporolactobacillus shoreicorticis TaxID=1923877 RepID=A0ABW5S6D9_9BACL|nr:hypothetical protein [Sporolactobacillus shoreicorticis]MCO7126616.1 hypothetical protein [Sporolactobacillus shoreicorticis]
MTYDEIEKLAEIKRRKKITGRKCAQQIGVSDPMISYFFNHRESLSLDKQEKLKNFIDDYPEYVLIRMPVKSE